MRENQASYLPVARQERRERGWHIRLAIMHAVLGFFPSYSLCRTRRFALAACGVRAGFATLFWGLPRLTGRGRITARLQIGAHCGFNDGCTFDLEAPIRIGDHVSVGHKVRFLTSVRREGPAKPAAITIGDGVWLGARCTILGGVTVGAGAVIGAGSTVGTDVPPNTLYSGDRLIPLNGVALPEDAEPEDPGESSEVRSPRKRLKDAWNVEFANLRWRLVFAMVISRFLPERRGTRLRAALIRAAGPAVGRGTRFFGMPMMQSSRPGSMGPRLHIGSRCTVGTGVVLEFGEKMEIGDRVSIGDGVVILTTTHQLGPKWHRAWTPNRFAVRLGDECSIGEGAIILPGVTVGAGARVLPESVVNANVAPGVTVGGAPARPVRI